MSDFSILVEACKTLASDFMHTTHSLITSASNMTDGIEVQSFQRQSPNICFVPTILRACVPHATHRKNVVCPVSPITADEARRVVTDASERLAQRFIEIDHSTQTHVRKVLTAMREKRVNVQTFVSADGYGHSDTGRHVLDTLYASIFACESAIVRIQFLSGTHAIASVLFGVLRPADELLCVAGPVYDTLEQVLGLRDSVNDEGSLKDFGISTRILPLLHNGCIDFDAIPRAISPRTKMAFIQRSFGYSWRPMLKIEDIRQIVKVVKSVRNDIVCFVDNCYGEFVESIEPVHESVGADVMAGSLIKNVGGGIVPSGGYVAGRSDIVDKARARFSAPGIGGGATLGYVRNMMQGLFLAPGIVGEAIKGTLLVAEVMSSLGYNVLPETDQLGFVRAIKLGSRNKLVAFCKVVQRNGPVGAFIQPTIGSTDGYADDVIFAQSTFIDGSTIELSADGPDRQPYAVFAQGGMHWTHWAIVLEDIVQEIGPCKQHPGDSG